MMTNTALPFRTRRAGPEGPDARGDAVPVDPSPDPARRLGLLPAVRPPRLAAGCESRST